MGMPRNPKRSGGPRSSAGKARSANNALKSGIAAATLDKLVWLDPNYQAQHDSIVRGLHQQYPGASQQMRMAIERTARTFVKLRHQHHHEEALWQKAQITAAYLAAGRGPNSLASFLPDTPSERSRAHAIAVAAAMPELERLDQAVRNQGSLGRQLDHLFVELGRQYEADQKAARAARAASAAAVGGSAQPTAPARR